MARVEQTTDAHQKTKKRKLTSGRKDRGQFLRGNHLELSIRTIRRLLVRSPAPKLCRVPEAISLHVIVGDFDHQFRAQRFPRKVLALTPSALPAGHALRTVSQSHMNFGPSLPWMIYQSILAIRFEKLSQFEPRSIAEAGTDSHML